MDKKQRDFMNFMAFMAMVEEQEEEERKGTEEYMEEKLAEAGISRLFLEALDEDDRAFELESIGLDPFDYECYFDSDDDYDEDDEWLSDDEEEEWDEPTVSAVDARSVNAVATEPKPVQAETSTPTKPAKTIARPLTKEERLLNSIQMPQKPENKMDSGSKFLMGFGILGLIDAVFGIMMGEPFFVIIGIVVGISFIIMASKDSQKNYEEKLAEYELAQKDFSAYQRKMVAKQKEKEIQEIRRRNKRW